MRIIIHLSCAHVNLCRSLFTSFYQFSVVKQQLGNARSVGHAHTGSAACGRYARTPRLGRHAPDRRTASRRMNCVAQGAAAAGRVLRHVRRTALICVARHIKRTAIVCAAHHIKRTAFICTTCHVKRTTLICALCHVKRNAFICSAHRVQRTTFICTTRHVKQTALCAPDQEHRVPLRRTHTYPHWPCTCITANTTAAEL